jgi:hypothetical protein
MAALFRAQRVKAEYAAASLFNIADAEVRED